MSNRAKEMMAKGHNMNAEEDLGEYDFGSASSTARLVDSKQYTNGSASPGTNGGRNSAATTRSIANSSVVNGGKRKGRGIDNFHSPVDQMSRHQDEGFQYKNNRTSSSRNNRTAASPQERPRTSRGNRPEEGDRFEVSGPPLTYAVEQSKKVFNQQVSDRDAQRRSVNKPEDTTPQPTRPKTTNYSGQAPVTYTRLSTTQHQQNIVQLNNTSLPEQRAGPSAADKSKLNNAANLKIVKLVEDARATTHSQKSEKKRTPLTGTPKAQQQRQTQPGMLQSPSLRPKGMAASPNNASPQVPPALVLGATTSFPDEPATVDADDNTEPSILLPDQRPAAKQEEEKKKIVVDYEPSFKAPETGTGYNRGGFQNMGNTCYAGSVLTLVLRSAAFQAPFLEYIMRTARAMNHVLGLRRKEQENCFPLGTVNAMLVDWFEDYIRQRDQGRGMSVIDALDRLARIQLDVEVGRLLLQERRERQAQLQQPESADARSAASLDLEAFSESGDSEMVPVGGELIPELLVAHNRNLARGEDLPAAIADSAAESAKLIYEGPEERARAVQLSNELWTQWTNFSRREEGEDEVSQPEWMYFFDGDKPRGLPMRVLSLAPLHLGLNKIIQAMNNASQNVTPGALQNAMSNFFDTEQHDAHEFMVMLFDKLEAEWQALHKAEERALGFTFRLLHDSGLGADDERLLPKEMTEEHRIEWESTVMPHVTELRKIRADLLKSEWAAVHPSEAAPATAGGGGESQGVGKKRTRHEAAETDGELLSSHGGGTAGPNSIDPTVSVLSSLWLKRTIQGDLLQTVTCWRRNGVCSNINYKRDTFGVVSVCVPKLTPEEQAARTASMRAHSTSYRATLPVWQQRTAKVPPWNPLLDPTPPYAVPTVQSMLDHDLTDDCIDGYKCDGCKSTKRQFQQGRFVHPLPPVLIVHLKRYEAKWVDGEFSTLKNARHVDLSNILSITSYDLRREVQRVVVVPDPAPKPKKKRKEKKDNKKRRPNSPIVIVDDDEQPPPVEEEKEEKEDAKQEVKEEPVVDEYEDKFIEHKLRRHTTQFKLSGVLRHLGSTPYAGHYITELCHRMVRRTPKKKEKAPQDQQSDDDGDESDNFNFVDAFDQPGDWVSYNDSFVSQETHNERNPKYDCSADGYILRYDVIPNSETVHDMAPNEEEKEFYEFQSGNAPDPYPNAKDEGEEETEDDTDSSSSTTDTDQDVDDAPPLPVAVATKQSTSDDEPQTQVEGDDAPLGPYTTRGRDAAAAEFSGIATAVSQGRGGYGYTSTQALHPLVPTTNNISHNNTADDSTGVTTGGAAVADDSGGWGPNGAVPQHSRDDDSVGGAAGSGGSQAGLSEWSTPPPNPNHVVVTTEPPRSAEDELDDFLLNA